MTSVVLRVKKPVVHSNDNPPHLRKHARYSVLEEPKSFGASYGT
jgi:hypothetical protein